MLEDRAKCREVLRCPRTLAPLRQVGPDLLETDIDDPQRRHRYPLVGDLPILVDFERSVLDPETTVARSAGSPIERRRYRGASSVAKRLASPPNPTSARNVATLIELLKRSVPEPRILVVGGGTIGNGMEPLYADPAIRVHGFDIYGTPNVQLVADAHRIPVPDGTFDGAIAQAVLEHVLEPQVVVAEIRRVLKPDGLVYAETPFMQQVHEGAYDFTRFTESGHRYLFRGFERLASGVVGGVGAQLLWSLDYFARSLFRSRAAGKLVKLAFFWLRHVDRFVPERYAVDGASGVYFLGRRSEREMGPKEIIAYYQGAQR